jgi:hypothetical protein
MEKETQLVHLHTVFSGTHQTVSKNPNPFYVRVRTVYLLCRIHIRVVFTHFYKR